MAGCVIPFSAFDSDSQHLRLWCLILQQLWKVVVNDSSTTSMIVKGCAYDPYSTSILKDATIAFMSSSYCSQCFLCFSLLLLCWPSKCELSL